MNQGFYERCWCEIDLDRIRENVQEVRQKYPGKKFCAVIKSDGYGHGAVPVAKAIDDLCDYFAVASVEEGTQLRRHGILTPILCLGTVLKLQYEEMIVHSILPPVYTLKQAEEISAEAGRLGTTAKISLALDTGMGRIGIQTEEADALDVALAISALPNLEIETVFSHFARADESDKSSALLQLNRFRSFLSRLSARGVNIPIRHIANSAGIIEEIGTDFDMVRDGISLYGYLPSNEVSRDSLKISPALSWRAKAAFVKTVEKGCPISYGGTFVTDHRMEIATVGVGYADGFPRALSNRIYVLVHGEKRPVLGRICMDQFMVDVTGLDVKVGDEVTILGRDGKEEVTLYDWEKCGIFTYEAMCGIGKRVPRIYVRNGEIIGHHDLFHEQYEDFL